MLSCRAHHGRPLPASHAHQLAVSLPTGRQRVPSHRQTDRQKGRTETDRRTGRVVVGRQGRAGQGRAGQGRAGQGRAGQGRAGQGRAGQGRQDRQDRQAGRQAGQTGRVVAVLAIHPSVRPYLAAESSAARPRQPHPASPAAPPDPTTPDPTLRSESSSPLASSVCCMKKAKTGRPLPTSSVTGQCTRDSHTHSCKIKRRGNFVSKICAVCTGNYYHSVVATQWSGIQSTGGARPHLIGNINTGVRRKPVSRGGPTSVLH
eukprot:COSAG02_NODE_1722_length_11193_cov_39.876600_7_plen_260_part_00